MEVRSTRIRHVSAKTAEELEDFIGALPFKVELKTLVLKGNRFYQFFVIPDNLLEMTSVDL